MSTYEKPQPSHFHGFDMSRTCSESTFAYAAPPFASQPSLASTNMPSYQSAAHMAHMAYATPTRTHYDDQAGPYLNVGSTPIPQVITYQPTRGPPGTRLYVRISSLYELMTTSLPSFFIMFGSRKCTASLSKMAQQGGVCQYAVTTDVPNFDGTGWSCSQVPIYMLMESGDGEIISKVDVGTFTYGESSFPSTQLAALRKRKVSPESSQLIESSSKRNANYQVQSKEDYTMYGYAPQEESQYASYEQISNGYGLQAQYGRNSTHYQSSPRDTFVPSHLASPSLHKQQSTPVANWIPYSTVGSSQRASPTQLSSAPTPRPALPALLAPLTANPPLKRTSTIPQIPSRAATPVGGSAGQPWNPYSLYPHKAALKIEGNLESMGNVDNWSLDEWNAKRRIVLFRRSQEGSTITTSFEPITLEERPRNSICISCIYWERETMHGDVSKSECFITSVDTISLLESLVGARFTVDEKNRIRRNLEGFHPYTVSKSKDESAGFYKTIMAFGDPRPRRIEKDVKVFPWKILSLALRKIIGKYVSMIPLHLDSLLIATKSSTPASTLPPTPLSSTGYATESSSTTHSHASDTQTTMASPVSVSRSISGTSISTAYLPTSISQSLSPPSLRPLSHHQLLSSGPSSLPSDLRGPLLSDPYGDNRWATSRITSQNAKQSQSQPQNHMPSCAPSHSYQGGHSSDGLHGATWDM
ncbi:MAG: hypothetical protein M1818_007736 [Claussenomyces sp. TS43310]|nr:MAG: hypothetical protein M1818_007736 [Claussenomyces sp. TS43310]